MSQSLGFFRTLYAASVRPRAFFEQWAGGAVRVHPSWFTWPGRRARAWAPYRLEALSTWTTRDGESTSLLVFGLAAASLVTAPLSWLYSTAVVHGLSRLFGVRGTFEKQGPPSATPGAPRVLGFLPLVNYVVEVRAIVVLVRGLQMLRGLKALAATAPGLAPLALSVGLALLLRTDRHRSLQNAVGIDVPDAGGWRSLVRFKTGRRSEACGRRRVRGAVPTPRS